MISISVIKAQCNRVISRDILHTAVGLCNNITKCRLTYTLDINKYRQTMNMNFISQTELINTTVIFPP